MDFLEFVRDIIIILIPTSMGVITSKWITNSWQERKEENSIKRKILEQLDESYHKSYSLIANFVNRVQRGYDDPTPKHTNQNKLSSPQIVFPTNINDMPHNKFKNEFLEFQNKYDDISYAVNRFGSSLALYYPSLLPQLDNVEQKITFAFHIARTFCHCQDKLSFEASFDIAKKALSDCRKVQQELAFNIINSKIENA